MRPASAREPFDPCLTRGFCVKAQRLPDLTQCYVSSPTDLTFKLTSLLERLLTGGVPAESPIYSLCLVLFVKTVFSFI